MTNDYSKTCARCGNKFACLPENIAHCQCSTVSISQDTRDYLTVTQYDCLCANCLTELDQLVQKKTTHSFPKRPNELIEGLHYYKENGLWVFTEFYHLLRGNCCESGCRDCAYGFKQ